MTINSLNKRVERIASVLPQQGLDADRLKEAALLFDTVDALRLQGHPECTYNALEDNYKTLVDLWIEEGGYDCTLTELNAAGKLDKIILQTCKGGTQHGND